MLDLIKTYDIDYYDYYVISYQRRIFKKKYSR